MSERAIETLLDEERRFPPDPAFAAQANAQPDIYGVDPDAFWEAEARERVTWLEDFHTLAEWELPYAKWFLGGKLNVAHTCVDRHVEAGLGERVAYHWEGEPGDIRTITYADLQREVVRMAPNWNDAYVRSFPWLVPLGPAYGLLGREVATPDGDVVRLAFVRR